MRNFALSLLFLPTSLFAQINPSDDFYQLPELAVNSTENYNSFIVSGSFEDKGLVKSSTAKGKNREDGWYSFRATSKIIQVSIETNKVANFGIFEGFAIHELSSKMTQKNKATALILEAEVGERYYIQIQRREGAKNQDLHGKIAIQNIDSPSFDEPCGARALMVNRFDNFTYHSNELATATDIYTTGECALYGGEDVWFKVIVPTSGSIKIKCKASTLVDGSMAIYKGDCSDLEFIGCNDDSDTSLMPEITAVNLTPGEEVYIRFWDYGNNTKGTFGISVTTQTDIVVAKD